MCGIGLISLSKKSTIHPRSLANALLFRLENRGWDASGWAYGRDNETPRYHKAAVPGGQLDLVRMPAHANNVILHTRMGTHGSERDNRNNHPVMSPNKDIAAIHNGVIWNHDDLRKKNLAEFELPEVDSSVIPALLQKNGITGLEKLGGDAAVIWLTKETGRTIHVARVSHSPFVMAFMDDGSIVGASTIEILGNTLAEFPEFVPTKIKVMEELEYLQILDGEIIFRDILNEAVGFTSSYMNRYRSITSGEKHKSAWDNMEEDDNFLEAASEWVDPDEDMWGYEIGKAMAMADDFDKFYVVDHWGNDVLFRDFEELAMHLAWYADKTTENAYWPHLEDETGWVNWYCDIGEVDSSGGLLSWTHATQRLEEHATTWWMRDGIDLLKKWV
jgi:hypothetical protein